MLQMSDLFPSPTNPRKTFPIEQLSELAESIKTNGVINPITVRQTAAGYEVVSGGRRYRASVMAGLLKMPCIVRDLSDEQVLDIQIEENLHRSDVPPLEEAAAFDDLLKSKKLTVSELAGRLNKSEAYVYRRLKLNSLNELYRPHLENGELPASSAEIISAFTDEVQAAMYKKVHFKQGDGSCLFIDGRNLRNKFGWEACKDLNSAIFPLDRSDLQPGLVACTVCPKNTAVATLLFPDGANKPQCSDKACWKVKEEVWKALALAEWVKYCKQKGKEPKYADCGYFEISEKKNIQKYLDKDIEVIERYHYEVVTQETEGAFEVLMVGETWSSSGFKSYSRQWVVIKERYNGKGGSGDWEVDRINEMEVSDEKKEQLRTELFERRRVAKEKNDKERFNRKLKLGILDQTFEVFKTNPTNPQLLLKLIRLAVRDNLTGYSSRNVWLHYFGEEAKMWMPPTFAMHVNGDGMKGEPNFEWTKGAEKAWQEVLDKHKRKGDYETMTEKAWTSWTTVEERIEFLDSILLHCDEARIIQIFAEIELGSIVRNTSNNSVDQQYSLGFFTELAEAAGIDHETIKSTIVLDPNDEEDDNEYEDEEEEFENEFADDEESDEE